MSGFSLAFNYQATDERMADSVVLPEGWYRGRITEMETKESNKPNTGGGFVNLTVSVVEGAHSGSQLYDNLMLWHTEEKVQNMTRKKLNTLCAATGQMNITDLGQLMNHDLYFRVATQEAREEEDPNTGDIKKYSARSQIKNYRSVAEHQDAEGQGSAGQPAGSPAVGAGFPGRAQAAAPAAQAQAAPPAAQAPVAPPAAQAAPATAAPATAPAGNKPPWVK